MKQAVGIELRRGVGIWAFVPMLIALVFITLAHPRQWAGDWLGWAYYQRTSLIVFGPLVVAAAAWQGGRERRRGLVELLASTARGPLQRTSAALASPVAWALLAFGAVTAAMAAVTASNTSYGRPPVLLTLGAATAVLLFAVVGYAVGRISPWRITAPVLALATYVALGLAQYGPSSYLSPGVQLFSGLEPKPWWPLASAGSFLLAAVGVLLLLGHRSRWFAVPVLGLAWLVAMPIANAGQNAFTPDLAGEALVCQGGSPQVCLTRRHADQLPAVAREVQTVLAGLDVQGPVNEQRFGLSEQTAPLNTLYLGATITGGADLDVVRQNAAQAAVRWDCAEGPHPPDDDLGIATFELSGWVQQRPEPPYAGLLAGLSEPQALALIQEFGAAAARCDLPAARAALPKSP